VVQLVQVPRTDETMSFGSVFILYGSGSSILG
jgi:hypothetical protein